MEDDSVPKDCLCLPPSGSVYICKQLFQKYNTSSVLGFVLFLALQKAGLCAGGGGGGDGLWNFLLMAEAQNYATLAFQIEFITGH